MQDPIEAYFTHLRDIHASGAGVAETSYYGPLATLLTDVGHKLKPKVSAIINLRNTGGGIPDGGLFTASQLKGWEPGENPLSGQLPARGAIEVKGTAEDAFVVAASEQVARYVERYGLVLVTNLRDFVLVGKSADGSSVRELESCRLATTEAGFWAHIQQPRKFAEEAGEGLTEFLRRVLLHNAPLTDPKDLAWFLASYARTARLRLEARHDLDALSQLRSQLEESLGLKFEGGKGDHFFRSTLVQTLFYGMFASWVLWARDKDRTAVIDWRDRFQWETASQTLHVPMVAELFYQFSNPGRLRDLHIGEVLEWAEEVLWRVDRVSFFQKFEEAHAVQYFYEPFLQAFDPQLRKELGVWYTPDEVVKYMVARVDTVLREELGIADGLADPSVVVLDPCCGTGAYLVEVLRKIDETLTAKGADALTRNDVKRAAMERVIGFEIMPAPFVVAHLQMGILLAELGVPLKDADERAAIYLTNALTGWGDAGEVMPPKDKRVGEGQLHSTVLFPEFAEERNAADRIKREEKVLVVIGNPPYNGVAGMAVDEERDLSESFRTAIRVPKPQGQGLNDLYVRFFRMAERQIAERSGRGVVCLISNYSWLDGLSHTGMREQLGSAFQDIWIDNLNGDKYKTGKVAPDGKPDPSIFSTPQNREGIQVGVAIALMCRSEKSTDMGHVHYRDLWGSSKLRQLEAAASDGGTDLEYSPVVADVALGMPFAPLVYGSAYLSWPRLTEVLPQSFPGVKTSRDDFVVAIDREGLVQKLTCYFDSSLTEAELHAQIGSAGVPSSGFNPREVRDELLLEGLKPANIVRYLYRPLDERWLYWETRTKLLDRPRIDYKGQVFDGNLFIAAAQSIRKVFDPPIATPVACSLHVIERGANLFPLYLRREAQGILEGETILNLSREAQDYCSQTGVDPTGILHHAQAIFASPAYAKENAGALMQDWPRLPLAGAAILSESIRLGIRIVSLLNPSIDVPTVTSGNPRAELSRMGVLSSSSSSQLNPDLDLSVTARWAIAGKGGITMPSSGKFVERGYMTDELDAIAEGAASLGISPEQAIALLGETCFDIYLNDVAYWRCVPANVWRYTIGGYQVIKKWLSYRERALLGRDLKPEEARYVTEMVRRIAALILMQPELDANYERVKADVWEWDQHR